MEVIEGDLPGYLEIVLTAPPDLMCAVDIACHVTVNVVLPPSQDDTICPSSGSKLPQIALVPPSAQDKCAQTFSQLNWPSTLRVAVAATVDSLVDGDVVRKVNVSVVVTSNFTTVYSSFVGSAQVRVLLYVFDEIVF